MPNVSRSTTKELSAFIAEIEAEAYARGRAFSALLHDIGVCHSTGSGSLPVGRQGRQPGCGIAMFMLCSL